MIWSFVLVCVFLAMARLMMSRLTPPFSMRVVYYLRNVADKLLTKGFSLSFFTSYFGFPPSIDSLQT